jgi:hypothetical protein
MIEGPKGEIYEKFPLPPPFIHEYLIYQKNITNKGA